MKKTLSVLLFCLCTLSLPTLAQVTTGTISGTVADTTGAVLPGTKVLVANEETGSSRTVETDAAGHYTAPSLGLGRYKVTATLAGFQTAARTGIELTVGREALVDFRLQVGAVTQTVEVTGEAPLVETTQSAVSALVNNTTINELPLNGRDLSKLVLLQPGVTQTENAAVATHRGYGTQINITGSRSDDNLFLLDGTDINDFRNSPPVGPNGVLFGAGSTREFQVQTSTFAAQYGRSLGGVFNGVSKSGTNTFTGEAFDFLRNSAVDARNFYDGTSVPPFRRNQFGGSFGGPIVRDKTFFYTTYEGLRSTRVTTARPIVPGPLLRQGIVPVAAPASGADTCITGGGIRLDAATCRYSITPIAASIIPFWPQPTPGGQTFSDGTAEYITSTPLHVQSDFAQARVDQQLSDKDSLFGRFTILNQGQVQQDAFPGYSSVVDNGSRLITLSETHIFSPRDLGTFRFAFNRNTLLGKEIPADIPPLKYFPDQPLTGDLSVTGVSGFGIGLFPFYQGFSNRFELIGDMMLSRGNHAIQFGTNFQRLQVNDIFPNVPQGSYSFRSWANFLQNTGASTFRGTPARLTDFVRGLRYWYWSGYIQDDWRVLPNLTLNVGIRYDFQAVPTEVNGKISNFRPLVKGGDLAVTGVYVLGDPLWLNPTTKDFAPRFGFAWTPFTKRTTTVRGGFGMFYGRFDFRDYSANRDGFIAKGFAVSNPTHFPDGYAELAASGTSQVDNVIYDSLRTPHVLQWSLNVQQQFGQNSVLTVGYAGSRGLNLISLGNFNAPVTQYIGGDLTVPVGAGPRNPAYNSFETISSNADSWYNGLTAEITHRVAAGLQFQVAYTFSKSLSNAEQTSRAALTSNRSTGYVFDVGHLDADKSLSPWDSRNVFKFNYVYELPWGPGKPWLSGNDWTAKILGGWQLGGIVTLKDGSPFTYESQVPAALSAATIQEVRPNAKPGMPVGGVILGKPDEMCNGRPCLQYYDPNSFLVPGTQQLGNIGRMTGIAPGIATWDSSIEKNFPVREKLRLEFRAEAFNIFNHANFGIPSRTVFGSNGLPLATAGRISDTTTDSRELQFGLKLAF
jgi:carboxypeptidase family protein